MRMRARVLAVALSFALLFAAAPARAGELDNVRRETQGGGSSGGSGSSSSSSGLATAIGAAVMSAAIEVYKETVWRLYTRYPYEPGTPGYVYIIPEDTPPEQRPGQKFAGSFTIDGAFLGAELGRFGLDLHLMVRRFGLQTDIAPHRERQPNDLLSLGSTQLVLAPILRPRVQLYAGLGMSYMIDGRPLPKSERVDAIGWNASCQATFLPIWPLIVRARVDAGTLGAATQVLGRLTVGAALRRFEFFSGYEFRTIGSVVLHGPTAGLRLWF